ncbi:hypothetical protein PsYK624_042520 [Phanerochaete sordida]|uniref:Uncharacterized protein n=1 Tax=Phanerochaete sordida TaxID=48140 RepID=A0A9P3G5D1_9APHY|nr:hypothetical protein PsYK624_042520 [Phanerochaete sordida]
MGACFDAFPAPAADTLLCRACRHVVVAATVGFIVPSITNLGIFATFTGSAVLAWVGYGLVVWVLHYGGRMRAWVDLGTNDLGLHILSFVWNSW